MRGDTGEKSTQTRDMVQFWSDHHQPTNRFVSHQEWGGPHGGAAYHLQAQAEKNKQQEETEEGSYPRRRHPLHRWYFSEATTKEGRNTP